MPTVTADWMKKEHDKIRAHPSWDGLRVALREHIMWEERTLFPRLIALGYGGEIKHLRREHDRLLDGLEVGCVRLDRRFWEALDEHGSEEVAFLRANQIRVTV
jgi:hypothetical protein